MPRRKRSETKSNKGLSIIVIWPDKIQIYGSNIEYPIYTLDRGMTYSLGNNLNLAIENCKTEYFVRIDGDDWERWSYIFRTWFYYKCLKTINAQNYFGYYPIYNVFHNGSERVLHKSPQGAGMIFSVEKFKEIGGYDETLTYQSDLDFYIRFTKKYYISPCKIRYQWYLSDKSQSLNKDLLLESRKEVLGKYQMKDDEVPHFGAYYL